MIDPQPDSIFRTAQTDAPATGTAPVPVWFWVFFVVMGFLSALYLGMNSGGFAANVFNPGQVSWVGGGAGSVAPPDPRVIGKRLFAQNCAVCHQTTGLGLPGQYPPLVGSEWVLGHEWHGDNHLVRVVLNGLTGPVHVKGNSFNNSMVPWKSVFKDEQIAAILTYVRSEWGNDAPPITADFVAKVRKETAERNDPWTMKELQAIEKEMIGEAVANPVPEPAGGSQPPAPDAGAAPPPASAQPATPPGA